MARVVQIDGAGVDDDDWGGYRTMRGFLGWLTTCDLVPNALTYRGP